ncbi:MAG: CRISPR-associated helicase/endonuclease Cas3, partial [Aliifodinibius sp.]|nr:CRISPR-associated helicase/endonuclease Cas3 [candidate division Zixibacteria bacterium]NIT60867.1 CRISPR-associated helicase/endonuclease Cas3 [Fodinibius sp.]NIW48900.1 CRISPR-associated helicase/endonuclease Cas3 [Gammaproteobacteria bacterium]NIS48404.1 CRISPR-associated helicase/endonuclease Cas3 [candidate division Zixibacteria bacterium]NIU16522.1 CRISPR-associated helicase/endonuclease Cas3 [candidate division Zixibacteria bacterium]
MEQTAKQFKNIFGDSVVEHHSNVEFEQETTKSRLACENWDAPVIVTTNVQFFESLYAARTSRARKVHNIINSVVILDEAQLVPPDFLNPILSVIKELNSHYGVSFVLCTATQPAWNKRKGFDWEFPGLSGIKEIVQNPHSLYQQLKRVKVELPDDFNIGQDWDSVAQELAKHESALCIVNTRKDCRALFKLMPEGTYHLSALMCAEHRSKVIKEIQDRLHNQDPIRVISTQLVEAGVDLDFPVVYRAVAGLDSIAQAAGRCNREGKLPSG